MNVQWPTTGIDYSFVYERLDWFPRPQLTSS